MLGIISIDSTPMIFITLSILVLIFVLMLIYEHQTIIYFHTVVRIQQWLRGKSLNVSGLPANCKQITRLIKHVQHATKGKNTIIDLGSGDGQALACICKLLDKKSLYKKTRLAGVEIDADACAVAHNKFRERRPKVDIFCADLLNVDWNTIVPSSESGNTITFFIYETFWDTDDPNEMMKNMMEGIVKYFGNDKTIYIAYMSGLMERSLDPQSTRILKQNKFKIVYNAMPWIDHIIAHTPLKYLLVRCQFLAVRKPRKITGS